MIERKQFSQYNLFNGIYRGIVRYNQDPKNIGRVKVFVPGVYPNQFYSDPQKLPWALPAMGIFGGNANSTGVLNQQTGVCSVPHAGDQQTGAQVFLFFQNGDFNYPVYFAVAQTGKGWFSQHSNQHVIQTDNVKVIIDQNPEMGEGTVHDSYTNQFGNQFFDHKFKKKVQDHNDLVNTREMKWGAAGSVISGMRSRVDIQVKADNLTAINLNIIGNANIRLNGDMFLQHQGDRFQTHTGNTYVIHNGNTVIYDNGQYSHCISGDMKVQCHGNRVSLNANNDLDIVAGGQARATVRNGVMARVDGQSRIMFTEKPLQLYFESGADLNLNNSSLNVRHVGDFSMDAMQSIAFSTSENVSICANDDIEVRSGAGNILIKTQGKFDLLDADGNFTDRCFRNLGNRGNIQVISTFGNIGINCIQDKGLSDFTKDQVCIVWNPSFVAGMKAVDSDFNATAAIALGMNLADAVDVSKVEDFSGIVEFLDMLKVYDSLPVFLPSKMIMQNPEMEIPENTQDLNWIVDFRSQPSSWNDEQGSSRNWKLPGRMMGNIDISTWSGDISIVNSTQMGCAGNINITANSLGGTLPGYKTGNVTINSNSTRNVYPDPRDLFLDSDFNARMSGDLRIFTHGRKPEFGGVSGNAIPTTAADILKSVIGVSASFDAIDYLDFYDIYGQLNIMKKGDPSLVLTDSQMEKLAKLKQSKYVPQLGCPKCIGDFLIGIPGVRQAGHLNFRQDQFSVGGYHSYGFQRLNPDDRENARGVFNILAGSQDKISIGDGHAIQTGFMNPDKTGQFMGCVTITDCGDFNCEVKGNYTLTTNSATPEAMMVQRHSIQRMVFDRNVSSIIGKFSGTLGESIQNVFGKVISIRDGIVKVFDSLQHDTKMSGFTVDTSFGYREFGIDSVYSVTYGGKVVQQMRRGSYSKTDFHIDYEDLTSILNGEIDDMAFSVESDDTYELSFGGFETKSGRDAQVSFVNILTDPTLDVSVSMSENSVSVNTDDGKYSETSVSSDKFTLNWNMEKASGNLLMPEYEFNTDVIVDRRIGTGICDSVSSMQSTGYYYDAASGTLVQQLTTPKHDWMDIWVNQLYANQRLESQFNENLHNPVSHDISFERRADAGNSIGVDIQMTAESGDFKRDVNILAVSGGISHGRLQHAAKWDISNVQFKAPVNQHQTLYNAYTFIQDEHDRQVMSFNNISTRLVGSNDTGRHQTDREWGKHRYNLLQTSIGQSASGFNGYRNVCRTTIGQNAVSGQNSCVVALGLSGSMSKNVFNIDNGSLSGDVNVIYVNNGKMTENSTNLIQVENGSFREGTKNDINVMNMQGYGLFSHSASAILSGLDIVPTGVVGKNYNYGQQIDFIQDQLNVIAGSHATIRSNDTISIIGNNNATVAGDSLSLSAPTGTFKFHRFGMEASATDIWNQGSFNVNAGDLHAYANESMKFTAVDGILLHDTACSGNFCGNFIISQAASDWGGKLIILQQTQDQSRKMIRRPQVQPQVIPANRFQKTTSFRQVVKTFATDLFKHVFSGMFRKINK